MVPVRAFINCLKAILSASAKAVECCTIDAATADIVTSLIVAFTDGLQETSH